MRLSLLDHGYASLIESWGSDEAIIEAARMSTGKGFLGWGQVCKACKRTPEDAAGGACDEPGPEHEWGPGDEKLLRYLWEHKHATPFEMAGLTVEIQAPIFVFREWHRHRTQSYSEMSSRYVPLPDFNYIPSVERFMMNVNGGNKQAGTVKGAGELREGAARSFQAGLVAQYSDTQRLYEWALSAGVPKELARIHLPVGRYSRMRASANLRNWLAFLTLRLDTAAQWEIRQYAEAVGTFVADRFPRTWELFKGQGA